MFADRAIWRTEYCVLCADHTAHSVWFSTFELYQKCLTIWKRKKNCELFSTKKYVGRLKTESVVIVAITNWYLIGLVCLRWKYA